MGKVVVITSGKGGVGKTTTSAALGAALAQSGEKVVVVDFDVGLRNLDLVMGAERRVVYDLVNVIQGEAKLTQALIRDKRVETLYLLPASQTRDKDNLTPEGVEKVITALKSAFDWVICDSPAGIERGATLAMRHADIAIVVTNPEVSSVRDSDRIIGLLDSKTLKAENGERMEKHLLLTRYDPSRAERGDMLKVDDVLEILSIPLLGIIPESMDVLQGVQCRLAGHPGGRRQRACAGLFRRGAPAQGRGPAGDRSGREAQLLRQDIRKEGGMNLLRFFSRSQQSAPAARERLQVLLAHERASAGDSDLVTKLRDEILRVIAKHVQIDDDKVSVKMERGDKVSTLEVDIEIPFDAAKKKAA